MFRYLKVGLSFVLCFVGVKMMIVDLYKIPIGVSLGVVGGILAISVLASLLVQPRAVGIHAHGAGGNPGTGHRSGLPARGAAKSTKAWLWFIAIAATLTIVKLTSIIPTGPSSYEAVVAIRVAQREVREAEQRYPDSDPFTEAKAALVRASEALKEKGYEDAIFAANKAVSSIGKKGQGVT